MQQPYIKCVVWDLDETIWDGVLLEHKQVFLKLGVVDIIRMLDTKGVLQSIASRNSYDHALSKLHEFGLSEYFLHPQISWNSKSESIRTISKCLNLNMDSFAFVDDDDAELEEVRFNLPMILCANARRINELIRCPRMNAPFISTDGENRRRMYQAELRRTEVEKEFPGPKIEFLQTLRLCLKVCSARESDLDRAEELTVRTHQLNTTGRSYSKEELRAIIRSGSARLLVAELEDRFGAYGQIGLCLIHEEPRAWHIGLFLMSCRVMNRGVGVVFLNVVLQLGLDAGKKIRADFTANDRNRIMYLTFKMCGFKEYRSIGNDTEFQYESCAPPPTPDWLTVIVSNGIQVEKLPGSAQDATSVEVP